MITLNMGKSILIFDGKVKVGFEIPIDPNKGFSPRMSFLCYQFSKSRFHDHFRTGEVWDDLVIKWLLGHCIHQHTDFSKGVLVASSDF